MYYCRRIKRGGGRALRIAVGITALVLVMVGGVSAATLTVNASGGADYTRIQEIGNYVLHTHNYGGSPLWGSNGKTIYNSYFNSARNATNSVGNSEQWNRTFGGTGYDWASSVLQTSDGGYVFAGVTTSYGNGNADAWLVKTDANGNQLWSKTFGGIGDDGANSVQMTSDGGYIIAGITNSSGNGWFDAWLIKTDASGNLQWSRTYGGIDDDIAYSVQQTSDGGYTLAGWTWSYGNGNDDAWLIKTDSSGNQQWSRTFGGTGYDYIYSVQQTSDSGYILAGGASSYGAGSDDAWLIKTDSSGNQQWSRTFGGPRSDWAEAVKLTSDGGYILAGLFNSTINRQDAWLIKTDVNGNEQWNRTLGGFRSDIAFDVNQTSDGYILTGGTFSYGAGGSDAWLIKTNASGSEQWNRTFGGPDFDATYSLRQTTDGGFILAGETLSYGAGNNDAWLIKVSVIKGNNTIGIYDINTGFFFLKNNNTPGPADKVFQFGAGGSNIVPLVGDWNGDGIDTIGIYDSNTGFFFVKNNNTPGAADKVFQFGAGGSNIVPLVGDWDGQ